MNPHSLFWTHSQGRIHLLRWGDGPQLWIALHGYGDRAEQFAPLAAALGPGRTLYAVDLPQHGRTEWAEAYTPDELQQLVAWILQREERSTCRLVGFSFGGRLALATWPRLGARVAELYLLAPDGLATRSSRGLTWLPLSWRAWIIARLREPAWLLNLLAGLGRWGLVPAFPRRFLEYQLCDPQRRARLFHTWRIIDAFALGKAPVRRRIRAAVHPVWLVFGTADTIVPPDLGRYLATGAERAELLLLEAKHHQLVAAFARWCTEGEGPE